MAPGPRPLVVAAVVALAALAFVGLRLQAQGGDVTAFVHAGDVFTSASDSGRLTVAEDSAGYDGQFSHRLARAPLSTDLRVDGTAFDRPVDRTARIGYPALAWLASAGGRPAAVPWALIGVNVAALAAIGGLAALLARDAGRSTWLGLLAAAWPGLTVALARDLTEPVAAAALLAAVVLLRRRRLGWAAAALVVAALTRETTLVLPLALVAVAALDRLRAVAPDRLARMRGWLAGTPVIPAWVGLVPLAAYGAWRAFLALAWDAPPATGPDVPVNGLTVPVVRIVGQLGSFLGSAGDPADLLQLVQLLLVLGAVTLAVVAVRRAPVAGHERVALVLAVLVLVSLSTWDRAVVFLRYPTDVAVLAAAVVPFARREVLRPWAQVTGALFLTTAVVWISIA